MAKARGFTDITLKQIKATDTRREVPDRGCAGLYLIVQPTGTKSWALRYRRHGKPAKLTLGPLAMVPSDAEPVIGHPLGLSQARAAAALARDQIKRGLDPAAIQREQKAKAEEALSDTVDAAMAEFMAKYKGRKRQGIRESTRLLTAHHLGLKFNPQAGKWEPTGKGVLKHWKGRPLASITKRDALALLDGMAPVSANRCLTALKTFFVWAVKQRDMLEVSPVALIDPLNAETPRDRILSDAEIKMLWGAADAAGYPHGPLIKLLLLTGARRDELRLAPWSEFDLENKLWTLPKARAKNGREHIVHLAPLAIDILGSLPRIGPRLFVRCGRERLVALDAPWTLHDLRRTFATGLQALTVPIEVIEECLNHKSGTRAGVAGTYAKHRYVAERTAALEAWAARIAELVR